MRKVSFRLLFQWTLGCLVASYTLLLFALDSSGVQRWLADEIEMLLEDKIHSDVEIGNVKVGLFNSISIHDITVKDRNHKEFINSKLLFLKLEISSLIRRQISIRNVALLDAHISLYKNKGKGRTNFQYILDALQGDEGRETSLNLRINSLIMRRCELSYNDWNTSRPSSGCFSADHIRLTGIDANLSLKHLTNDSLNLRVRHLQAQESCGLALQELRMKVAANRSQCSIRDFVLKTSRSEIREKELSARYDATDFHTLYSSLTLSGALRDVILSTEDLAPFIPSLKKIKERAKISALYTIAPHQIKVRDLKISNQDGTLALHTDLVVHKNRTGVLRIESLFEKAEIKPAFIRKNYVAMLSAPMPQWLLDAGELSLQGKIDYTLKNKVLLKGNLSTEAGLLAVDVTYKDRELEGVISSRDFNPSLFIKHKNIPTFVDFQLQGTIGFPQQKGIECQARLDIHKAIADGKTLHQLSTELTLRKEHANLVFDFKDPAIDLNATISSVLNANRQPSRLKADVQVSRLVPSQLGLTSRWNNGVFSFQAQAEIDQLQASLPTAHLCIKHLTLQGDAPNIAPYYLEKLDFSSLPQTHGNRLLLTGDFAELGIEGFTGLQDFKLNIAQLMASLTRQMEHKTPNAFPASLAVHSPHTDLSLSLAIKRTDFLKRILKIDIEAERPIVVEGGIFDKGESIRLAGSAPHLKIGNFNLNNLSIVARNQGDSLQILAKAEKHLKDAEVKIELGAKTQNGQLHSYLQWKESLRQRFHGKIASNTNIHFPQAGRREKIEFTTEILPTNICINDSLWEVKPGRVIYGNDRLSISNLSIAHADQHLSIAGAYAQGSDGIVVDLRKVDVGYALALTGLDVVTFGGRATGRGILRPGLDGNLQLLAYLDIPHFRFNNTFLGHAEIQGGFDGREQTINLDARIKEADIGHTNVKGFVSLGKKALDLQVESENTPIAFLNQYIDDIFHDIRGRSTGRCRIFGSFKAIDFEGKERATASAKIPVTGVTYHLHEADVKIAPGEFNLTNALLTDSIDGSGTISGKLNHRHLREMSYDFSMSGNRIKLYDRPYELDMPFYATAFGSGKVKISGSPGRMDADIQVDTDDGSVLTYILDSPEEADRKLVTFRDLSTQRHISNFAASPNAETSADEEPESKTDIRLNLEVNVQPSSKLRMITDIKSGDVITTHGSGPIRASYYNKGAFRMFGVYNVRHGNYDLSIQNLIKKNFTLLPGGTVSFSGDPLNADVDVKASYLVNSASLADLNIGSGFNNNPTPVNCLIHFTGKVSNMNLGLDFDLPNVGEDEKMMVRSMMASEEDRTMQVLYLLGVGRFFTYNYAATASAGGQSQSSVMMKSLLSSTLSAQINNILSNAVGSSNWTFGANVATGQLGWSDMEVDGSLSGRLLNNRLLVNGKVGYHERQAATTNFVGDFDVHYLLTPSGSVNLKAYSETNDRYFSKSTLSTQGVGIQLKRDFHSLRDLFFFKKRKSTSRQQQ